jgi:hypothetical protein
VSETRFKPGDYVLIRCKVLDAIDDEEVGYAVEIFSKTDQYKMWVRPDLVIQKVETPVPLVPDHDSIVRDKDGDFWSYDPSVAGWRCRQLILTWRELFRGYSPLTVFEESETYEP